MYAMYLIITPTHLFLLEPKIMSNESSLGEGGSVLAMVLDK